MQNFFYFIDSGRYIIADSDAIKESYRTVDIFFNDLATDEKLLDVIKLMSHWANKKETEAIDSFAFYLASFGGKQLSERKVKLLENPKLRILIEDKKLLKEVKEYLERKEFKRLLDFAKRFAPDENIFFV